MKRIKVLLLLFAILLVGQSAFADSFDLNNPALVKLIEKDQKLIAKQGYGNLVVPAKIHKIDQSKMPEDALWVCEQLTKNGFKAYIIGGAVRDLIMGLDPDDYDVTTDATHADMEKIFGDKLHSHVSSGVTYEGVRVKPENPSIDLASFGLCPELYIEKGVVAKKLVDKTLLGDSYRRDFAFNSIFYEPATGKLYDFHGGIADIRNHTIHTIAPPEYEFKTNPSAIPRAIRFQAKYQYDFDPELEKELQSHGVENLKHHHPDVLINNISRMFQSTYGERCLNSLMKYNMMDQLFPSLSELKDRPAYNKWVKEAVKNLDAQVKDGFKVFLCYPINLITYPVFKQLRSTMSVDEAVNHIFDTQLQVMQIKDYNRENFKANYLKFYKDDPSLSGFTFDNPDIVRMINEDYELVKKQGYGNLVIPASVNKISLDSFDEASLWVANQLQKAGFEVYFCGGAVRDLVMGIKADDFDFVTNATHEDMVKIFGDKLHTHKAGKFVFEDVEVEGHDRIDLASFMDCPALYIEKGVAPNFTQKSLLGDSFQRDLPMNAMYYNPVTGDLIDYHGGLHDLLNKTIHTTTDPDIEYTVEQRAPLRALRFRVKYGFAFSPELEECMLKRGGKYHAQHATNSLFFNLHKLFINGQAKACYDDLCKYSMFDSNFPAVKIIKNQKAYRTWVGEQLVKIDERVNSGEKVTAEYPVSVILYPAYKQLRKTMSASAAAKRIIDMQLKAMDLTDSEKASFQMILENLYKAEQEKTDIFKNAA